MIFGPQKIALKLIYGRFPLGKPSEKNWIFYDNELISTATYPPYLIMT